MLAADLILPSAEGGEKENTLADRDDTSTPTSKTRQERARRVAFYNLCSSLPPLLGPGVAYPDPFRSFLLFMCPCRGKTGSRAPCKKDTGRQAGNVDGTADESKRRRWPGRRRPATSGHGGRGPTRTRDGQGARPILSGWGAFFCPRMRTPRTGRPRRRRRGDVFSAYAEAKCRRRRLTAPWWWR